MAKFKPPKDNVKHREQILAMDAGDRESFIRDLLTSMDEQEREHLVTRIQLDYQKIWDSTSTDEAHATEAAAWVNEARTMDQDTWAHAFKKNLTTAARDIVRAVFTLP